MSRACGFFEAPTWFAVFLSRGASEPIIRKLNRAAFATAHTPSVQKGLNVLAAPADSSVARDGIGGPDDMVRFVKLRTG
jgi:hypothetical protein